MKKGKLIFNIFVGIIAFSAGFLLRTVWNPFTVDNIPAGNDTNQTLQNIPVSVEEEIIPVETDASVPENESTISADSIQVRIDDGLIQWYDGTVWHTVATVEELSHEDKFYQALESFQAFSQELQQEKAENLSNSRQTGTFWNEETGLSVGKKETPKPTPKPATPPPTTEESAPQEPSVENTVPTVPSAPAAPSNPVPSNPTTPSPTTPPPSGGDGEDINADDGWSDLVL